MNSVVSSPLCSGNYSAAIKNKLAVSDRMPMFEKYRIELQSKADIAKKLRISINDICNFNCFYCHNEGQEKGFIEQSSKLSIKNVKSLVEIAVHSGIESIKITGGEPLIYKDDNCDIVDLVKAVSDLRRSGLKFSLSLVTNGSLLSLYADDLRAAGLNQISVTLPTLSQDLFEKYICFDKKITIEKILEGIRAAASCGFEKVKINMPLFYSTSKAVGSVVEINSVIKILKTLNVSELRLYTLLWHKFFIDFNEYYQYWDDFVLSNIDNSLCGCEFVSRDSDLVGKVKSFSDEYSSTVYPKARMILDCKGLPVCFETMKYGRFENNATCSKCPYSAYCQEGAYALRVTAKGKLKSCLLKENGVDILSLIREGKGRSELLKCFKSAMLLMP